MAAGVCHDTPKDTAAACCDTARSSARVRASTWQGTPTTRPGGGGGGGGGGHDTVLCAPCHGAQRAAWMQCACRLSQGVHLVHPTQF